MKCRKCKKKSFKNGVLALNKADSGERMDNPDFKKDFSFLLNIFCLGAAILFLCCQVSMAASVTLTWNRNQEPDIAGYKIYYGTSSHNYSESTTINDTATSPAKISHTVSGLGEGITYYFAVKAFDLAGQFSDYSSEVSVAIPSSGGGGGSNGGSGSVDYCSSQGGSQKYEWISQVGMGGFSKSSGASSYSDFTNEVVTLSPGKTVSVSLKPGFSGKAYTEYWRVWIDYNRDGDFSDPGELVFSGAGRSTVTGTFKVPGTASGTTRMRVTMTYKAYASPCGTVKYGEVEDYTVSFGSSSVTPPPEVNNGGGGSNGGSGSVDYCSSQGGSQKYEWISQVGIGSFFKGSGASSYSDFTGEVVFLSPGETVSVSLKPGFSGKAYIEYWRVWIDYNRDGDFSDPGELVFSGAGKSTVTGTFKVPGTASGTTRMRVTMTYKSYASPCGTVKYGEVEDYTVEF